MNKIAKILLKEKRRRNNSMSLTLKHIVYIDRVPRTYYYVKSEQIKIKINIYLKSPNKERRTKERKTEEKKTHTDKKH